MDSWPKQTGNVAGSRLHGKLATNSEAVCLNYRAICLFRRGSPALVPYWLCDQMTLLYKKWKRQLTHTAASVPKPVITDGVQLLQGIQWYLLVTWVSWCSCSCRCHCLCWAAESNIHYSIWCRSVWEVMEINSLCQLSILSTLPPSACVLVWPPLLNWCSCSDCAGSNNRATDSENIGVLMNFSY